VLLSGAPNLPAAGFSRPDPHPFLVSEDCLQCHETRPDGRPGTDAQGTKLKEILPVCLSCHPQEEGLHPVGMRPDFTVPPDLRLDVGGVISCVTCHRAHGERYSRYRYASESLLKRLFGGSAGKYKTYYLRRANAGGELCLACHY
jgi:hypothetical protein